MSQGDQVQVRFFLPPADLLRYFTTFYYMEFNGEPGTSVTDHLHPEWANLRFFSGNVPDSRTLDGARLTDASFCATGPSSKSLCFTIAPPTRMWGVGLLPLGWARFVREDAMPLADRMANGADHPAFASFIPLAESIFDGPPDIEAEYDRIARYFGNRSDGPVIDEARIVALHAALVDPEVKTVTQLVERAGCSQRTLERISHRAFGFSPKLLLRRQRFLRSLAHYVTSPSAKWIGSLDGQYHDQAQFVRDFRSFMGMTPREYAALDKPILGGFMQSRAQFSGLPVQALDRPEGGGHA